MEISGHAAHEAKGDLSEYTYQDDVGAHDVAIKITHCGICHSDVHLIDDDWGMSDYPFIPGHEVVGIVEEAGEHVNHLKKGDRVGVGWQCNSCHHCEYCMDGSQQNCPQQRATCVGRNGGYADGIVVDSKFAIKVPEGLKSESAAPMMCGGITVYTPISEYTDPSDSVAVVGIGGLGHFAVLFAAARGCEVTAITTHPEKKEELIDMGVEHVIDAKDADALADAAGSFDAILNTAPANLDWNTYLGMLKPTGTFVQLGAGTNMEFPPMALVSADRKIVGSHIGSPAKIAEMLAFADENGIEAEIEEFSMQDVNSALKKVRAGDVHYRVVLKNE